MIKEINNIFMMINSVFQAARFLRMFLILAALILNTQLSNCQSQLKPIYAYLSDFSLKGNTYVNLAGPARIIIIDRRSGLNTTSIKSVLELKAHNMKEKSGTVTLWVLSLEDLATSLGYPNMGMHNPDWRIYPLLSDCPDPQDFRKASFKWIWYNAWHPNLIALFGKGGFYEETFNMPHKAYISVSHFILKKHIWYQFALTWNYENDLYKMFVNGIQVGVQDQNHSQKFYRDTVNTSLYLGNPTLCYSNINFYGKDLSSELIYSLFKNEVTKYDQGLEEELLTTYQGKNHKPFTFSPDASWTRKLNLSFTKKTDLDSLYVQGNPVDVRITSDGLLIETINREMTSAILDSQMYVWTKKPFEGDLYVEYEYKTLRPGGLSLLLTQASGMNREDFMADYPLRTSGRMTMIYGEDVRSYHWEYYREMADMRNDLDNSAIIKEPFNTPLGFSTRNLELTKNAWHKLQFLQTGNRLVGAIDGVIMFDVNDTGFNNNGPVYDFGRIAIRCMLRTKMVFRDLKVYNKPNFETAAIK